MEQQAPEWQQIISLGVALSLLGAKSPLVEDYLHNYMFNLMGLEFKKRRNLERITLIFHLQNLKAALVLSKFIVWDAPDSGPVPVQFVQFLTSKHNTQ